MHNQINEERSTQTRIKVGGNNEKYGGHVSTSTAHLEIAKMLFNSVLLRKNSKYMTINVANFYLMTPI